MEAEERQAVTKTLEATYLMAAQAVQSESSEVEKALSIWRKIFATPEYVDCSCNPRHSCPRS